MHEYSCCIYDWLRAFFKCETRKYYSQNFDQDKTPQQNHKWHVQFNSYKPHSPTGCLNSKLNLSPDALFIYCPVLPSVKWLCAFGGFYNSRASVPLCTHTCCSYLYLPHYKYQITGSSQPAPSFDLLSTATTIKLTHTAHKPLFEIQENKTKKNAIIDKR